MPVQFTPDGVTTSITVPYFEDAKADIAPGYATTKSAERLQSEIGALIVRLGGSAPLFRAGAFKVGAVTRYGYEVAFSLAGNPAVMQVAGLPIRTETAVRREQVRRQALFVVEQSLRAALSQVVFSPGYSPLIQFILMPGTGQTVGEAFQAQNGLPMLTPPVSK